MNRAPRNHFPNRFLAAGNTGQQIHRLGQCGPNSGQWFPYFPESANAGGVVLVVGFDNRDQRTGVDQDHRSSVSLMAALKQFGEAAPGILGKRLSTPAPRNADQILNRFVRRSSFLLTLDQPVHRFPQNMRRRHLSSARNSLYPVAGFLIQSQTNGGGHDSILT
jgi:hypothetical protein